MIRVYVSSVGVRFRGYGTTVVPSKKRSSRGVGNPVPSVSTSSVAPLGVVARSTLRRGTGRSVKGVGVFRQLVRPWVSLGQRVFKILRRPTTTSFVTGVGVGVGLMWLYTDSAMVCAWYVQGVDWWHTLVSEGHPDGVFTLPPVEGPPVEGPPVKGPAVDDASVDMTSSRRVYSVGQLVTSMGIVGVAASALRLVLVIAWDVWRSL